MLGNLTRSKTNQLQTVIDTSKPIVGEDMRASGAQFSNHGKVMSSNNHSRHGSMILSKSKGINLSDENQYKSYVDRENQQDKLKIISEDFIDGLIDKRNRMQANKAIKSYNEQTKGMKSNLRNEQKIPNVASISNKKASMMLHNGSAVKAGYSYNNTTKKDMKTLNIQKNKAIDQYRKKI
jgi:hypothetical protein